MIRYIIRRLLLFIPILLGITIVVQILMAVAPGDPARMLAGSDPEPGEYEQIREDLGLDKPIYVRYWDFLKGVLQGDFGTSFTTKRPILPEIMARFPYTLFISTLSILISTLIGIPIGILAATHQYKLGDKAAILLSLLAVSMPAFWFALLLVQLFAVKLRWLPVSNIQTWKGWILPIASLSLGYVASIIRQMRSNMLEVVNQDFLTTARAKGLSEQVVLYKHALKNALIPVVMTIGSMYGMSLGGALIAEMIFSIPGLGSFTLTGLTNRDYPVIQATVLFLSALFCLVMLLIDVAFAFIDPRIRSQFARKKRSAAKREKGEEA
ncbi:MAG: ABC transporter permease [Oscillospiraceae bacterium]|jgi:peptide/nickel transport system permease protein|nr:ABC transporter permease [Oscillospiraceae bacterium]